MKITHCLASVALVFMLGACSGVQNQVTAVKGPVDYVNPYMGNIVTCWCLLSRLFICRIVCFVFIPNGRTIQQIS